MTHCCPDAFSDRDVVMSGMATLTTATSSTTMNCARQATIRTSLLLRSDVRMSGAPGSAILGIAVVCVDIVLPLVSECNSLTCYGKHIAAAPATSELIIFT